MLGSWCLQIQVRIQRKCWGEVASVGTVVMTLTFVQLN